MWCMHENIAYHMFIDSWSINGSHKFSMAYSIYGNNNLFIGEIILFNISICFWTFNIVLFSNRNLKPASIYLRGEVNETQCSLIIGDMTPPSVALDIRMRTRLPRRM
jgi:hypothetical protein